MIPTCPVRDSSEKSNSSTTNPVQNNFNVSFNNSFNSTCNLSDHGSRNIGSAASMNGAVGQGNHKETSNSCIAAPPSNSVLGNITNTSIPFNG
jgi:hypothetical protein